MIRGYFGFSYYHPIRDLLSKLRKKQEEKRLVTEQKSIEKEKRQHTKNLISKIDAQRSEENENADFGDRNNNEVESGEDTEIIEPKEESVRTDFTEETNEVVFLEEQDNNQSEGQASNEESIDSIDASSSENIETFNKNADIEVGEVIEEEQIDLDEVQDRKAPKKAYQLPSADILDSPSVNIKSGMSRDELVDRANFLQQSLETFGVVGKVVNVSPGPVITLFEVEPAEGVRVNKFVALSDDLARVMEASRVRVIAPIPGKSSVGIEIPNTNPDMVYF